MGVSINLEDRITTRSPGNGAAAIGRYNGRFGQSSDRSGGVTSVQRQGYRSLDRAWGAAVRADFVSFGDATVIDPGQRVAVTHHKGSRRSLREPITQSLGWAVRYSKTSGALVVRGVGRSQASDDHGCRSIARVRCSRAIIAPNSSQCSPKGVGFDADETLPFKELWGSMIETG